MQQGSLGAGSKLRVEHRLQDFILHFDQIQRLMGNFLAGSGHPGNRVANITHAVTAKDIAILQVQTDIAGEIIPGDHRFHARQGAGLGDIESFYQRMGMRAALDAGIQQAVAKLQVIGEDGSAGHFFTGINARFIFANRAGRTL